MNAAVTPRATLSAHRTLIPIAAKVQFEPILLKKSILERDWRFSRRYRRVRNFWRGGRQKVRPAPRCASPDCSPTSALGFCNQRKSGEKLSLSDFRLFQQNKPSLSNFCDAANVCYRVVVRNLPQPSGFWAGFLTAQIEIVCGRVKKEGVWTPLSDSKMELWWT
ncbi:hypothetical protein GGR95_000377 [Sulfitobacter undariae]|uniref:Uncharacterized protein n=1 Tax=Sulfitobacter undariae TaxID=1563671 RepID=A0A7W6E6N5_9RHOB|nr:hypothetical protein [Sulfitobacter undariae]